MIWQRDAWLEVYSLVSMHIQCFVYVLWKLVHGVLQVHKAVTIHDNILSWCVMHMVAAAHDLTHQAGRNTSLLD